MTTRLSEPVPAPSTSTPTSAVEPLLLDVDQLAALLGLSRRVVYTLMASGRLPEGIKLGHSRRWDRREIERWVASGCPPMSKWGAMRGRAG